MAKSLDAYEAKRNFAVTKEPRAKRTKASEARSGDSFVIQKHAARRLHYDFRLEMDGALKSWAITRGPSLDPSEKRLAVHVEDHPLEYASFEGTIPKGQYGGGTVLVWDKGRWLPEGDPHKGYEKGHLSFILEGKKLRGGWHLVRMKPRRGDKGDNWLLLKADDAEARGAGEGDILEEEPRSVVSDRTIEEIAADPNAKQWQSREAGASAGDKAGVFSTQSRSPRQRAADPLPSAAGTPPATGARNRSRSGSPRGKSRTKRPEIPLPKGAKPAAMQSFIEPCLATFSEHVPTGGRWIFEIKFDGYRIQASLDQGEVIMSTRGGLDWTHKFPNLCAALKSLQVTNAQIDGEVVVEDRNGLADFSALQDELSSGSGSRLVYYMFDLMYLNGHDLTRAALVARKDTLKAVIATSETGLLRFSEHFENDGRLMLDHVCRLGGEGIVSKKRDSAYRPGRNADWLKSKCFNQQEFVIAGFVPSSVTSKAVGSLVLGVFEGSKLVYAGRVGSGFGTKLAADLYAALESERIERSPFADPLPPEARRNVRWVEPRRVAEVEFRGWTSAGILRQAAFKGLRDDKDPRDIVREPSTAMTANQQPAARRSTRVELTHPDRVLWPGAGITKQGLADFYSAIWDWIGPHIVMRPLSLLRCPGGIEQQCFFQKHAWEGIHKSIELIKDPHDSEPILGINDLDGLIALVQASVLEIHPWGSSRKSLEKPDRLILDLDPGESVAWSEVVAAAKEVRQRLSDLGLESFVKTSGGKGLHVVLPVRPKTNWDGAKAFCHAIAEAMSRDTPSKYTATMAKRERHGRIFVDYLRNTRGATAVSAYSTRAREGATVSVPLAWDELGPEIPADHFSVDNLEKRLANLRQDPWKDFFEVDQVIPATVVSRQSERGAVAKTTGSGRAASKKKG